MENLMYFKNYDISFREFDSRKKGLYLKCFSCF